MSLKQIAVILWSRRYICMILWIMCVLAAAVTVALMPRKFAGVAQIFVSISDTSAPGAAQVSPAAARNYIATHIEGLRSIDTAIGVAKSLALDKDPSWLASFQDKTAGRGEAANWIGQSLLTGLQVSRQAASDLILVSFTSRDAETAAQITNAFVDTYIRQTLAARTTQSQEMAGWYDERLTVVRQRLTGLEEQRSQIRHSAVQRGDSDAFGQPQTGLTPASRLAAARHEFSQARSALEQVQTAPFNLPDNAEVQHIRKQITDLDFALARDVPQLGRQHRRIQGLMADRQRLNNQAEATIQRLRSEQVETKRRELALAERRVQEILEETGREEDRKLQQNSTRAESASLDKEIDTLRGQLDALIQRRERFIIEASATTGSIMTMSRAIAPFEPSVPRVIPIILLAAGFGLAFGIVTAFLREMFDRRVRCPEDIKTYTNIPVLSRVKPDALSRKRLRLLEGPVGTIERIDVAPIRVQRLGTQRR